MRRLAAVPTSVVLALVAACSANTSDGSRPLSAGGMGGADGFAVGGGSAGDPGTNAGAAQGGSGGSPSAGAGGAGAGSGGRAGASNAGSGGFAGLAAGTGGGGVAGSSMDAGLDPFEPQPSTGCNKPAGQDLGSYIRQTVTGMDRVYDLYVPEGYDQNTAYRAIFVDHGCDGSIPWSSMPEVTEGDAILIALRAESSQNSGMPYGGGCFDTGPGSTSLTEVPYFDQVLEDVANNYCIDMHRVFMSGYSSGSWLTHLLGCVRAGVIRGQGNAAGGLPDVPECAGPIAAMLCHDMQDDQNVFAEGEKARDRILASNGCTTNTEPYDWDGDPNTESSCVLYQGCMPGFPVVWCPSTGKGHGDQSPVSTVGMWRFWSQF